MQNLKAVMMSKYAVISVMGPHAGESEVQIFRRKREDIDRIGRTFWLHKSNKAAPSLVQQLCKRAKTEGSDSFCIFIESSSPGGSQAAKSATPATRYSEDKIVWHDFPDGLGPVTGNLERGGAHALIFDQLDSADRIAHINLWDYADFSNQEMPLITKIGQSTVCAIKKDTNRNPQRMMSPMRRILAVGRLSEPYCVYLR